MQKRWLAVHLLLAFIGAQCGWALSWQSFIDSALLGYLAGTPAQSLYDQLATQEFAQAGTLFQVAGGAPVASQQANAELFAR